MQHTAPTRPEGRQDNVRFIAFCAAAMYAGALFLSFVEGFTPGGSSFAIVPGLAAVVVIAGIIVLGPHARRSWLFVLGPLGVALIGYALSASSEPGDGAVLYIWPVLWTSYFYGRRGLASIVVWIGIVHAFVLMSLNGPARNVDRWIDVMVVLGVTGLVISLMSKRERALIASLEDEARVDPLTSLLNRRGFEERIPAELARAQRSEQTLSVVMFDIDRFKAVNDEWGHECGDRVLAGLGRVLQAEVRASDLVARLGGEEFIVLLADTPADDAHAFAERVREACAAWREPEAPIVSVSAGVSSARAPDELEPLIREADFALYAAKRGGRNRTVVHTPGRAVVG